MRRVNVLMTGSGAPGAPGIIRCLLQADWINLTVGDAAPNTTGNWLHPQYISLPKASEADFADRLAVLCKLHDIEMVLPLVTSELFPLSAAKNAYEKEGIKILISSEKAINIANNKTACYTFLKQQGIKVPQFFSVDSVLDFEQAAHALDYPKKPFCFKPSVANGSRGFRMVSDNLDESDLLFNNKPYQMNMAYDQAIRILSGKPFPQLLVTEYLPGEEYSVDCLANEGLPILIVPRLRSKMTNGISTAGTFINDVSIIDYCAQIIKAIGLHGNIGIQLKRNKDGDPLLLEINPRVQGTIVAGLGAGINLPLLAVMQELGMAIETDKMDIKWGTSFQRYWTEVYRAE